MSRLVSRIRSEDGWAVLTSVLVMGILISLALPLMSLVDTQQSQSAHERKSEGSFNLAEATYDGMVFLLSSQWPGYADAAYDTCTSATASLRCPDRDLLERTYSGRDYSARTWRVEVRDDVDGGELYSESQLANAPTWDSNGNGKVWVRAEARAATGQRSVVGLVRMQEQPEPFPRNAITAGKFAVASGGHKVIVDTKGKAAQATAIAVRCTTPAPSPDCLGYSPERGQVSPDTAYTGYTGDSAVSAAALERLRLRAKALGTYYPSGCPQSPGGELVFVENGNCSYAGGREANSQVFPGVFIVARGTFDLSGSATYHGLVYAANLQASTGTVVTLSGASQIVGAVAVDGPGGVVIGSNGRNLVYDERVFPRIKSFGAAATVQGTWRELPAS